MLDKSIPYHDILMHRPAGSPLPEAPLPPGFIVTHFEPGMERDWARIEASVGEFDTEAEAQSYFQENYLPYQSDLRQRCLFLLEPEGLPVGTFTIWWEDPRTRLHPWVHWVALCPAWQGNGLGKALVIKGLQLAESLEGKTSFFLHTQTWSYKALGIYLRAGFQRTRESGLGGYANTEYDLVAPALAPVWKGNPADLA